MIVGSSAYGQNSTAIFQPPIIVNPPIIFIPPEPSISVIPNQTINEDTTTGPIAFTVFDFQTPAGSLFVSAISGNIDLVPRSNFIFGGSGGNRTVTVIPAANQSGQAQITIRVSDGQLFSDSVFTLTVLPVNDTPTVNPLDTRSTDEDTPLIVSFFFGDEETPLADLTVTATSSNQEVVPNGNLFISRGGGTIVIGPSVQPPRLGILPGTNRFGSTLITISVSDGNTTGATEFILNVLPVDDPPTISPIADQIIDEDSSTGPLGFKIEDIDTPLDKLLIEGASNNPDLVSFNGIVFGGSGPERTVTVTPIPNQSGLATVRITVGNGGKIFTTEDFNLLVNPMGEAPEVTKIPDQKIDEDTSTEPLSFTFWDADTPVGDLIVTGATSDPEIVPVGNIRFTRSFEPVIGRRAEGTGTVIVTPAPNKFGSVKISVLVSDGKLTTASEFFVNISPVNDGPTIRPIDDVTISEDTSTSPLPVVISDVDSPPGSFTVSAISDNQNLVPNAGILIGLNGENRTITVTPAPNQTGSAKIIVTVSDGLATATDEFVVTVTPVNDAPVISAIADQTINEDSSTGALAFTISDVDNPVDNLTVSGTSGNANLVPNSGILIGLSGRSRTVTVTPLANQNGSAVISLTVSDGIATATEEFVVNVTPVNDPPTISRIVAQTINEDTSTGPLSLAVGDLDTPIGNLTVSAQSNNQSLVPNAGILIGLGGENRTITVTPAADQTGSALITVTVSDGTESASQEFLVTVTPVNDAPVISAIADQTINEDGSTAALAFTISDVDNPVANLTVSGASGNANLVPNSGILIGLNPESRTVTVTPLANQNGSAVISLTVSDGTATATEEFVVNVTPVNDPPVISAIADQTIDEDSNTGAISFTVADVDSTVLTVSGNSSNTGLVLGSGILIGLNGESRTVTVTPLENQNGSTTISLTVSDGIASATEEFVLNVTPVNDGPLISAIADQTINEDSSTAALAFTITDVDSPVGDVTVSAKSSNIDLVSPSGILIGLNQQSRTILVTPLANQHGATTISLTATDGAATGTEEFVVNVTSINDPPVLSPIATQVIGEYQDAITVDFKVSDVDTPLESLSFEPAGNDVLLLPANLLNVGGAGENRTLRIARLGDVNGDTVVKLRVRDGQGGEDEATFDLRILPVAELRLRIARQRDRMKLDWFSRVHLKYQLRGKNFVDEPWQNLGEARPGIGDWQEYMEGPELPGYRFYILLVQPL